MKATISGPGLAAVEPVRAAAGVARGNIIAVVFASRRWKAEWPDAERIARIVTWHTIAFALAGSGPALDATIVLADDARLRALNRRFRDSDTATNVLAFPLDDTLSPPLPVPARRMEAPKPIGDVAIAYETLLREAGEQDKAPEAHLAHLVAHGLLHLLGCDHRDEKEFAEMSRAERAILACLGYGDPYMSLDPTSGEGSRRSARSRR